MIILADIHAGKTQDTFEKNGMSSRLYDATERFKEAILFAADKKEAVVVAGDIFDSNHPLPYTIDAIFGCLRLADEKKVPVYLVLGNHDSGVTYHSLRYANNLNYNVQLIDMPMLLEIDGIKTLLLPHVVRIVAEKMGNYTKWVQERLMSQHMPDLIVGHVHVTGAKNTSDIEIEAGDAIHFDPSEYPKCLCVFGHIHKHQVIKDRIIYTGPVVTNSFDEADIEKGFVWVKKDLSWEFIPYTTPETKYVHVKIDLVSGDAQMDFYKMRDLVEGALVKVTVYAKDQMQVDKTEICRKLNEFGNVVRFETVITNKIGEISDDVADELFEKVNYVPVLHEYLESKEMPKEDFELALTLGMEVIEEVTNVARADA